MKPIIAIILSLSLTSCELLERAVADALAAPVVHYFEAVGNSVPQPSSGGGTRHSCRNCGQSGGNNCPVCMGQY